MARPQGILKNPHRGRNTPRNEDLRPISSNESYENLLPTTSSSSTYFLPLSTEPQLGHNNTPMHEHDRRAAQKDIDDLVPIPIHDPDSENERNFPKQRNTVKIQFPDTLAKDHSNEFPGPYPYVPQDSDGVSVRSSITDLDEDDDEVYDWSDEEDLVDEQAKFEKKLGVTEDRHGCGFKRIVMLLFSSLIGSVLLAGILITPGVLVHFYYYKPHPTDHRKYVKDNVQAWLFWAAANLVISWALAMIIDIIPIFIRYLISATWGHVSEAVKTRIETYDSVKNTAKPAFYAGSGYASWAIIFGNIYNLYDSGDTTESRAQYTNRLAQVVEFFFFLILVWRVQAMCSHFIAFSFHRTAYKERIEEIEKALIVIEKLRQYRPKVSARHTPQKSGTRTPVFGSLGFPSTLTANQHYKALSGALKQVPRNGPLRVRDIDSDGDVDDANHSPPGQGRRRKNKSKDSNRASWFGSGDIDVERRVLQHNLQTGETETTAVTATGIAEVEIEMMPTTPSLGQVYNAAPAAPSHLNPNRYPLATESPRGSLDNNDYRSEHTHTRPDVAIKQAAKVFKHAILHDARNISGDSGGEQGTLAWNVNSAHESKRLARSIFARLKDRGRNYLIPSDFNPAFPDQASAEEAFKIFDKDNNGDLSRAEIKTVLVRIYKERRFLSRSMRDVGEALKTLDHILLFFAAVILFFIALSVFGVEVGDSLSSVYTIGIAASFIFKASAAAAFDAIMLLFVTHPYDTGDRVMIGTYNLVVKRVGLFATVFTRSDGTETYYFNSQLFSVFILNMRRSGKTFENLTMQVVWTTPLAKLDALEKCLNDWLSTEENRWFEPSTNIVFQNIAYQRYLEITIGIGHNGNWQDWGLRNARKTAFHAATQYYCQQLGIVGYEAPMPIVYANPQTKTYQYQPPNTFPDPLSPPLPMRGTANDEGQQVDTEVEDAAKDVKPTLGFLPPLADRSSHLTRVRKSKNRKANLGAGN